MATTEAPQTAVTARPGQVCPGCGAPLTAELTGDSVGCPACGRSFAVPALIELQQLSAWAEWAQLRADWLHDRLAAGDLPATGWSALPGPPSGPQLHRPDTRPVGPPVTRHPATVGSLLLAGGAVLLVLAGIAFVAFAWDLLGPAGQLFTLYAMGTLALIAGVRLRTRLPGTATTLGVVGALLVAVSTVATRVLAVDQLGETVALLASLIAAVALATVGIVLSGRQRAVGEVAALVGAALALGLLALAPVDDALSVGERWAWWPAVVLLVGGVMLLLLAHRFAVLTWPALAGASLLVGSLVLAGFVMDRPTVEAAVRPFLFVVVLLMLAPVGALLVRVLPGHRPEPGWVAAVLTLVAVLAAVASGAVEPASRPGSAVALTMAAGLMLWAQGTVPRVLRTGIELLAAASIGAAVGFAVAPWTDTWAVWRGPLAGLALGGLLVFLAEVQLIARHAPTLLGVPALVAATIGLAVWLTAVVNDFPIAPDDVRLGIAVALALWAAAGWFEAVRRHVPVWSVWLGALAGSVATGLAGDVSTVDPAIAPEAAGVALGVVAASAGTLCWWLRRPEHTSSLVTIGPALTLLLAPSTLAMIDAATSRWWFGDELGTAYQVRVVGLFVVSATLIVVGAWQRLAGVLAPAAAALVTVTAVQLVELGRFLPQWVSFAVAGALLIAAGARWEWVRDAGHRGGTWVRSLR